LTKVLIEKISWSDEPKKTTKKARQLTDKKSVKKGVDPLDKLRINPERSRRIDSREKKK
jgi:hypothetical protein